MAIYTQLSPIATPGKRYSFSAKPLAAAKKGTGPFTALSVLGIPGAIHSFVAKTAVTKRDTGGRQFFEKQALHYKRIITEDKELLNIIIQAFISGIFD